MRKIIAIFLLSVSSFGCASIDSRVSKAYVQGNGSLLSISFMQDAGVSIPSEQKQLLVNQIREGLSQNGLLATEATEATEATDGNNSQHSVIVNIHTFRMRGDAARLTVGIMAGCDNISSTVIVTDKITGKEIGNAKVSIKECAAWGVASQVITKYTDGVVAYLTNK